MIVATGHDLGLFQPGSNETTFSSWAPFANMSAAEITAYAEKDADGMTYARHSSSSIGH